jgi:hypothetical protein
MSAYLNPQFWLNPGPGLMTSIAERLLIGEIIIFILATILCFIFKRKKGLYRLFWVKLFNFFLSNALVGALLLFINQELILFLSARAWFAIWWIGMIVWIIFIVNYAKKLPEKKTQIEKEKEYKKYLP